MKAKDFIYNQITEKAFTAQVIKMARVFGWLVHHCRPALSRRGTWMTPIEGDAGLPDILALRHDRAIMAELKSATGRVTPEQAAWLVVAKEAGLEAYVWRPAEIEQIERILR